MKVVSFKSMVLMVMIMITMMGNMAKSELHYVGGTKSSWKPNVNMTEWSLHEKFFVDDWLYFGFDKHMYNVLQVNKTSYENCVDKDFIKNITKGGRDVFQLKEVKTYYFLSAGGYCWSGMKVAINVQYAAPAPQPVPPENKSSADSCSLGVNQTLVVLVLASMWGILFK